MFRSTVFGHNSDVQQIFCIPSLYYHLLSYNLPLSLHSNVVITQPSIQLCAMPLLDPGLSNISSIGLVVQLKKRILKQILGCAPLFWLPLEHFAHEVEELLFFLSLEKRDGPSKPEVWRDQVLADEFSWWAKGGQYAKLSGRAGASKSYHYHRKMGHQSTGMRSRTAVLRGFELRV